MNTVAKHTLFNQLLDELCKKRGYPYAVGTLAGCAKAEMKLDATLQTLKIILQDK